MGRSLPGALAAGILGAGALVDRAHPLPAGDLDCLSPASPVQRVALMKGAQIGGTECGNCWIGYVIHQAPGPMMAVAPTVELAKRNSKQRIDPLIEESEVLRERVKERRSRNSGNTVLSKEFPGGVLILTGANSAVADRDPIRTLQNQSPSPRSRKLSLLVDHPFSCARRKRGKFWGSIGSSSRSRIAQTMTWWCSGTKTMSSRTVFQTSSIMASRA